jgi:hypothetical protein
MLRHPIISADLRAENSALADPGAVFSPLVEKHASSKLNPARAG